MQNKIIDFGILSFEVRPFFQVSITQGSTLGLSLASVKER